MRLKGIFLFLFIVTSLSLQAQENDTIKSTAMRIGMTSVFVDDPVKAFHFYTDTLGFVEVMFNPEASIAIVASAQDPDGTFLLLEPNGNSIAKEYQKGIYESGIPAIVFFTNDIQAEYERLKSLGVEFKKEPTKTEYGMEAVFDDGHGNWIQLMER